MTARTTLTATLALAMVALTLPTSPAEATPAAKPPCTTGVVWVAQGTTTPCDVSPPQRLSVVYPITLSPADAFQDCLDAGGEYMGGTHEPYAPAPTTWCYGTDY